MTDTGTFFKNDLSKAYSYVIRHLLKDSKTSNIKDLDDLIKNMGMSMMSNMEILDGEYNDFKSKLNGSKTPVNDTILKEMKTYFESSLKKVKTISKFIDENDHNIFYLDQYIKNFTSYIHFQKDKFETKLVNEHPYLSSPLMLDMLTKPLFGFIYGRFTAVHTYYMDDPDNPEEKIDLFTINSTSATISREQIEKAEGIAVEELLNIEFSRSVKPEVKDMVKETILKLTSSLPSIIIEIDIAYVVHCLLDTDIILKLVLPKKHLKLKK